MRRRVWIDAIATADDTVPGDRCVPGVIATVALIMINMVPRSKIMDGDGSYDDGSLTRARVWLLLSYVIAFASLVAAVWILIVHYENNADITGFQVWPGVAGVIQTVLINVSGLCWWSLRPSGESAYY